MFLFKIGKTKHKFKLKFTIAKFTYEPQQNLDKHCLYKIKVTRGSHSTEIISLPVRKNMVKFPKTEYTIPVTLFYDEDDKTYLQKQAQVKAYLCDENGQHKRTIGKTQLNIAEYTNNGKFALQVQVDGQQKKYDEKLMIVFHMFMERQDDDSKSVNTYSDQQSQKNVQQNKKSKDQQSKKNKNLLKPNDKNYKTVKSTQDQTQKNQEEQTTKSLQRSRMKSFQRQEKVQQKLKQKIQEKKQKKKIKRTDSSEDQSQKFFVNKLKQQAEKQKLSQKQKILLQQKGKIKQNEIKISKNTPSTERQSSNKLNGKNQQEGNGSVEFRLYIANKKVADLQSQNSNLKKKNEQLKKIVEKFVQQGQQKKTINQKDQYSQQIEYYKKIIIQKQIKLSQVQGSKKNIQMRQNQNQKLIVQLKTQNKSLKTRLQFQKNKVARIMQKVLQCGDTQIIAAIQSQAQDQYF